MHKLQSFIFGALLLSTMAACHTDDVGLTDQEIFQSDEADILNYATTKGLSGTLTSTGVYYVSTKPGSSSVSPANGLEVEYNSTFYALSRSSSTTAVTERFVDSTYATKSSYSYIVATNPGITEGLLRMHEGEQATILLPSIYAFGRTGTTNGAVPPNTPVRVDVTLKRVRTEDQQINEYLTANKLTPSEVSTTGLRIVKTVTNSTGATPASGQTLVIRYKGKLLRSASAFDSTGTGTYSGALGNFVPGFSEGLAKLKVGEQAIIVFPSRLGYGSDGRSVIPPYAPLRFDIELVSVQ
ncbi:FKBP-type peptidyl-prolyl cis-trans isomerase [Spirosoma endophyticum]|uniref:Peptidyl-prolyl cis-trans isomerase n=1 Tax=Spirosoma endophyticum TaxID=662367 RepID=A0A1I1YHK7_9BACT|nr:FKBP-type peptidyl-prolyl cis-trans isomerase [Spirosoma endophyticum]SFE19047.1 FKBP-type peptidyl-prolyl cis-trans isomerase [Spirosoma endophyticum]